MRVAEISAPKPAESGASCTTTQRHAVAPGHQRDVAPLAGDRCLSKRHGVSAIRHLGPTGSIKPIWLAEENRVGVADRLDQQAFRVERVGRHHDLDPGRLYELRLHCVGMELGAADTFSERSSDRDLAVIPPARALAVLPKLWTDLVERLGAEAEELYLRARHHD